MSSIMSSITDKDEKKEEVLRLFLALWPDDETRHKLASISRKMAGKQAIRAENLHLTLVFLGATSSRQRLCYEQALQDLTVPTLQLTFDQLGCWSKAGILWLGPSHTPDDLTNLVLKLNQRLSDCGFQPERRPFRAHVTLARHFNKRPGDLAEFQEPFSWRTDQIVLVKSITKADGSDYQVLRCWP